MSLAPLHVPASSCITRASYGFGHVCYQHQQSLTQPEHTLKTHSTPPADSAADSVRQPVGKANKESGPKLCMLAQAHKHTAAPALYDHCQAAALLQAGHCRLCAQGCSLDISSAGTQGLGHCLQQQGCCQAVHTTATACGSLPKLILPQLILTLTDMASACIHRIWRPP